MITMFRNLFKFITVLTLTGSFLLIPISPVFTSNWIPEVNAAGESCTAQSSKPNNTKLTAKVGGVALDQAAKFLADMTDLTGAYYDGSLDRIVFVGKKNTTLPQFDKDDLAVAIKMIVFENKIPWFSLEANSTDENKLDAIYSSKSMVDTKFGKVMFDADFQLKKYIKGYDENKVPVSSTVPGYKPFDDIILDKKSTFVGNSSSRWWLTPEYISLKKDDPSSSFVFDTVKMQIKTEPMSSSNDPLWNQAATEFANHQTQHFDEFAQESPSYASIKQLGKIAAVVKWIKDSGVATDFQWASDYAPKIVSTPKSISKFPARVYSYTVGNTTYSGTISGGADLITANTYSSDTTGASSSIKSSSQSVPTTKEDIHWTFTKDNQQYEAVAVTADAFRSIGSYNTSVTDFSFPTAGDLDLAFQRSYSSYSGGQYGAGRGWNIFPASLYDNDPTHIFNCSGVLYPKALAFSFQGVGFESFTISNCTTGYVADDPSYHSKMIRNTDGTFTVKLKDQKELSFDTSYRLTKIKDKNLNQITYSYDADGKLVNISDSKNHTINISYNTQNLISNVSDWSGRNTQYTYDSQGNLLSAKDPNGNSTTYAYNDEFKLVSITDRMGNIISTNSYTPEAKLSTQSDDSSLTTNFTYNKTTREVTASDNLGRVNKVSYDSKGRILSSKDSLGNTIVNTYGVEMSPLAITDKLNNKITNTYDVNGNLTSTTFPDANKIVYSYDTKNRVIKIDDYRYGTTPKTTTFTYNLANNLSSLKESSLTTSYTYDVSGEKLTETDPLFKKTTWTRDSFGNPLTVTDPNSNTTIYEYNSVASVTKQTDADGKITNYTYDNNGNLLTIQNSAGTTSNTYNKEDMLTATILPNTSKTEFSYDNSGALTSVKDATLTTTTYGLDNYKNLISQTNGLNNTTTNQYDNLNRRTSSKSPLGKEKRWEYDANGNITKRIDANGSITNYLYDSLNRLTKTTYPDGKTINYTYDNRGNLIRMVDLIGTSTFIYDIYDRLTQSTNPFNQTIKYTYNDTDKLTKITYPDGKSVSYSYDNSRRLTGVSDWNYKSTTYGYNKNNAVASRTLPNGIVTTYAYDASNRLSEIKHSKSTTTLAKFTYERDSVGNITKALEEGTFIVAPTIIPSPTPTSTPTPTPTGSLTPTPTPGTGSGADLVITNVTYNPANPTPGQLFTITTTIKNQGTTRAYLPSTRIGYYYDIPQAPTYQTLYNDFNNITVDLQPGQTMQEVNNYAYFDTTGIHKIYVLIDQQQGLTETNEDNNYFGPVYVTLAISDFIQKFASIINNFSFIKSASAQTASYTTQLTYDLLGRLTSVKYPNNSTYNYTFDKADNRLTESVNGTTKQFSYDGDNKLTQGGELTYYYDNNGNQSMKTQTGLLQNNQYSFSFENKLTKYVAPNNNTHNYRYDGFGNRLEKEFSTAISRWTYDISEKLSKLMVGPTGEKYIWGLGLVSQGSDSSSTRQYYLEDGMDNTRFLTDYNGNKKVSYEYDPYGNIRTSQGATDALFKFQAEQSDDILNLYYLRARFYDPATGRFISQDPIEGVRTIPQSQNPYAYALNNPIIYSDPSGEQAQALSWIAQNMPTFTRWGQNVAQFCSKIVSSPKTSQLVSEVEQASTKTNPIIQSTGRSVPMNLGEQLALKQVMADPTKGELLKNVIMGDTRWPASEGWVKMQETVNGITIHWNRNTQSGATADFKFVNPF